MLRLLTPNINIKKSLNITYDSTMVMKKPAISFLIIFILFSYGCATQEVPIEKV